MRNTLSSAIGNKSFSMGKSGMNNLSKKEIEERVQQILEAKGRKALEKAKKIMLEDIKEKELHAPLQYLSENWNDTLRPALMALSCEAVGGKAEATTSAATAMTLLCSSMNIYDNIMDRTKFKRFIPTLPEKFGNGLALIVAGLVTAKAFNVLYEHTEKEIPPAKHTTVNRLFQEFLMKMSEAEALNLSLRRQDGNVREKFRVLQIQAADIEACMKIGATIGCGSEHEVEQLGRYGLLLGTTIELREDLWEALNYTTELADKIRNATPPYVLTWAVNHSEKARDLLSTIAKKEEIKATDIKKVVEVMFEAGAVNHVNKLLRKIIKNGKNIVLELRESEAKHSLKLLVKAQESLLFKAFSTN